MEVNLLCRDWRELARAGADGASGGPAAGQLQLPCCDNINVDVF